MEKVKYVFEIFCQICFALALSTYLIEGIHRENQLILFVSAFFGSFIISNYIVLSAKRNS